MEDNLDISTDFDNTIKRGRELRSKRRQLHENEIALIKSEIVHLKNLHNSEVDRIKTKFHNELEKVKSDHKTEIQDVKNQHKKESDQMDFDFTKKIEKIKQQNINQIKQLKQQHQCELIEIRREINENPKVTKISSEESTKTSDK